MTTTPSIQQMEEGEGRIWAQGLVIGTKFVERQKLGIYQSMSQTFVVVVF